MKLRGKTSMLFFKINEIKLKKDNQGIREADRMDKRAKDK